MRQSAIDVVRQMRVETSFLLAKLCLQNKMGLNKIMDLEKAEFYSEQMTLECSGGQWFVVSRNGQIRISKGYITERVATVVLRAFVEQRELMIDTMKNRKMTRLSNVETMEIFACSHRAQFLSRLFERFVVSGVICDSDMLLDS